MRSVIRVCAIAVVLSGLLLGIAQSGDRSGFPLDGVETQRLALDLAMQELLVDTTVTEDFAEWVSMDLTGMVPSGTYAIYVEIQGHYLNGRIGDGVNMEVRKSGVPASQREFTLDGLGNTGSEGQIFAWLPVDPNAPAIEYHLWSMGTPDATATMKVYLRGYVAVRQ